MCDRAALNDSRSVGRSVTVQNLKVNKNAQVTEKIIKKQQKNRFAQERWKIRR